MYSVLALNLSLTLFQTKRKRQAKDDEAGRSNAYKAKMAILRHERKLLDLRIKHNVTQERVSAEVQAMKDGARKLKVKEKNAKLEKAKERMQEQIEDLRVVVGEAILDGSDGYISAVEMSSAIDPSSDKEYSVDDSSDDQHSGSDQE